MEKTKLTHIDASGNPAMVDVGSKAVTSRMARAQGMVVLPQNVLQQLSATGDASPEIYTRKGSVFQTAIIAGTMAVKKTSELIPFCHPLPLEHCHINISLNQAQEVIIDCTVRVTAKTGVEMEAHTGVTVAALTIYDMCKALSQDIMIKDIQLMEKSGGSKK